MAAGRLPKPGSKYGPCVRACKHIDCRETRNTAATACRFCDRPIGYDTAYIRARLSSSLAHEACMYEALDRNDARLGEF